MCWSRGAAQAALRPAGGAINRAALTNPKRSEVVSAEPVDGGQRPRSRRQPGGGAA